ncbi:MAG: hypothetical protein JWM81_705 [Candidatus Saccharibacteria bacterium]|nr:hypothetical protein [Candidatus Saccharibacteria bacterium]
MHRLKVLFASVNNGPTFTYGMALAGLVLTIVFALTAWGEPGVLNVMTVIVLSLLTASYGREIILMRKKQQ